MKPAAAKIAAAVRLETLTKAEQSRRTRRLVIETGAACLARFGYAQTTMLLIASEAGLSRGPLHYHFADRNAVMAAIAENLPKAAPATIAGLLAKQTIEERLEAMLDLAIEEHTGPHHYVAMELLMAARNDHDLASAISPHLTISEGVMDDWWDDYFSLLSWPRERLLAFRRLTVACLRGLALDHVAEPHSPLHRQALELFREMFIGFAGDTSAGKT